MYLVYVRDDDENKPAVRMSPYYGGSLEPPEPVWCAEIIDAETRAQAKHRFLQQRTGLYEPIYEDDWPLLRVRLLTHDATASYEKRWLRVHEVLDHAGSECDCPYAEEIEASIL